MPARDNTSSNTLTQENITYNIDYKSNNTPIIHKLIDIYIYIYIYIYTILIMNQINIYIYTYCYFYFYLMESFHHIQVQFSIITIWL